MPHVYMLRCADDSYYVGSTRDLGHRLQQHAIGKGSVYTSTRLPVEVVWVAEYARVDEAYAIERKLHGWSRAKKEALIRGDWALISRASRRRGLQGSTG
jgi:putative endonuclease